MQLKPSKPRGDKQFDENNVQHRRDAVMSYVSKQGSCEPDDAVIVGEFDGMCEVWKVTVRRWLDWKVPHPPFFYAVMGGATNLYRSDFLLPDPWKKKQDQDAVVEYVRSYHVGLITRLMQRDNRCAGCGQPLTEDGECPGEPQESN